MSRVVLENSALCGGIELPLSKSYAHRALICSYLSGKMISIDGELSQDISATQNALLSLEKGGCIDCGESGSTLRFLIPITAALGKEITFTGRGKLPQRPLGEYLRLLPEHGVKCESKGGLPLKISGKLKAGEYSISGDISSQYVTGLLFSLPLLEDDSEIVLTSALQSKPYVDMTVEIMARFGIKITETERGYKIRGNQKYIYTDYTVERDWSQAAFFLAGGALTGSVTLRGMNMNSLQGDKEIVDVLRRFGADITVNGDEITAKKSELCGIELDATDIPDAVPAIAVVAAFAKGKTVITGAERLRYKESDRLESVAKNLERAGIDVAVTPDGLIITGGRVKGAEFLGFNDHRIVMAFSIAALRAEGKSVITDALSINKSYPDFFRDYRKLGGKADVICNG